MLFPNTTYIIQEQERGYGAHLSYSSTESGGNGRGTPEAFQSAMPRTQSTHASDMNITSLDTDA